MIISYNNKKSVSTGIHLSTNKRIEYWVDKLPKTDKYSEKGNINWNCYSQKTISQTMIKSLLFMNKPSLTRLP